MDKEKIAANSPVAELEPRTLWKAFATISSIPHCSGNEEAILQAITDLARGSGLEHRRDEAGNLLVLVPAAPGRENDPSICIQAHVDMVCEKNQDTDHDFERDPIELLTDETYVYATNTTLGADNGIGVASMIAIMQDRPDAPALELLFTVDEERGLTGALGLQEGFLHSDYLINTDTEEDGAFYIGCAGGADSILHLPVGDKRNDFQQFLQLELQGLHGGHSGIDIHRHRANAIAALSTMISALALQMPTGLVQFSGGDKRNAIPREARVVIGVSDVRAAEEILNRSYRAFLDEFGSIEDGSSFHIKNVEPVAHFDSADTERILALIAAIPHGPLQYDPSIPELVETSNNLASIRTEEGEFVIVLNSRSSITSALEPIRNRFELLARLAGGQLVRGTVYPGWKPEPDSHFLTVARDVYLERFGQEPAIRAIHAGLETGVIGDKFKGMQMISIGPEINFPHSPVERVEISSVERYYQLLLDILRAFHGQG